MKQTENYNLPLYEPNDLADLTDGYNNAMELLDTDLKAVSGGVEAYDARITANTTAIEAEVTRATEAENANTSSINAEITRAKAAEQKNSDAIATEQARAEAAEKTNAEGIKTNAEAIEKISGMSKVDKILCIGDSYARMEDAQVVSWCKYLGDYIGATAVTKYAEGGSGWATTGISNHTFTDLVNQAISGISDKDRYTHIFIAGGINDANANASYDNVKAGAKTILSKLRSAFPSARIIAIPLLWYNKRLYNRNAFFIPRAVNEVSPLYQVEFVNWAWTWGLGEDDCYDGGIHPNNDGGKLIASYITQAVNGSYSGRTYIYQVSDFGSGDCYIYCNGGTMSVMVGGTYNNKNGTLNNAVRGDNMGSQWGVIYAGGGSSMAVLVYGNEIAIYGGGDKGNIGGCFVMAW